MRGKKRNAPLTPSEVKRLRKIPAEGPAPDIALPMAFFTLGGAHPPRIATDVRPVRTDRASGWQVTVSALGPPRQIAAPPRFEVNWISRRRRPGRYSFVPDAFRPRAIAFAPEPRRVRRIGEGIVLRRDEKLEPIAITGKDDRRTYNDTSYPWGCICRITSGGRVGSGVLIGPRHVLTASHVIDWNAGWAVIEVHRFDAGFASGGCVAKLTAFTKIGNVDTTTVDEDYAVLTLFDRLGDQFGWMGSRRYDSSWDDKPWWRTIGYPQDISGGMRPVYERDFHLDEDELDLGSARAMECGADLMKGHSGGPIFAFWPDGVPYVVAVVSADSSSGTNYCAGGSWLPELVQKARDADP